MLGNPGTNQSEGGRTPSSEWGQRFKALACRGRTVLATPPIVNPPLPPESVQPYDRAYLKRPEQGTVRSPRPIIYHGFEPGFSSTMLYVDLFGTMASRGHKPPPIIRLRGYSGEMPSDLQPRLTKAYPWNDPTAGAP